MILFPAQLEAINRISTVRQLVMIELVAMPMTVQITTTYKDGSFDTKLIDQDGKERTYDEVFGYKH